LARERNSAEKPIGVDRKLTFFIANSALHYREPYPYRKDGALNFNNPTICAKAEALDQEFTLN